MGEVEEITKASTGDDKKSDEGVDKDVESRSGKMRDRRKEMQQERQSPDATSS